MSKRKGATPDNVLSWILRGDGQGELGSFKPFLHVRDVASQGRSAIDLGLKTGRRHHYLSDIEYAYHILAEYAPNVTDIREQFALLPWEETQQIAEELGIRHPTYPGTSTPIVMTTDIVLTAQHAQVNTIALSVKMSIEIDLENKTAKRTLEKLLIEKKYWERRSIPWILCTEKNLPANRAYNLDFLRNTMQRGELDHLNEYIPEFVAAFCVAWNPNLTLSQLLARLANDICISKSEAFVLLGRSIWMRHIYVDLDAICLDHNRPIPMKTGFHSYTENKNV